MLLGGVFLVAPGLRTVSARTPKQQQPQTIDQVKIKIAKLGLGAKARATVNTKDGRKIKGYVSQAGEDDFTLRDKKTDAPTTIRYADVAKVSADKGHSLARNLGLGIAIGAGAFLGILLIIFASLND